MYAMDPEGAGPSLRPSVTSEVKVDPGDIRDFARFLDEMGGHVEAIEKRLAPFADGRQPVDFGAYYASDRASEDHHRALAAARANAAALRRRIDELSEGTLLLARRYAATEDLNRSVASEITSALRREGA